MPASTFRICQPDARSFNDKLAEAAAFPGLLRTMVRNLIDAWPQSVYSERIVETKILGRRTFFVTDPGLIRELLVDQANALVREDTMGRALRPALGNGILTADDDAWRVQRRLAAPMFRPDRIRSFVPAMVRMADATRDRWLRSRTPAAPFDLMPEMMRTTFDIIVATMMSGDHDIDVAKFEQAMDRYLRQTNWKIALAMLGAPEWVPHPGSRAGAAAARHLRKAVAQSIATRKARGSAGSDLLGLLLEARDPDSGEAMPETSIIDNLLTFVSAGHETTALALTWTFRLLADHPAIESRVLAELAAAGPNLTAEVLDRLTYTRQVISEAMRLYPPAPLIVRRTAQEINLGGSIIPAHCSVHVPVYALHRHARLWDRPTTFDPDRFDPKAQAARHRYAYLPFGAGPRVCIGMGFAMTECLAILATLLPAFHLRSARPSAPDPRFRVTLRPHRGMPMIVTPRDAG